MARSIQGEKRKRYGEDESNDHAQQQTKSACLQAHRQPNWTLRSSKNQLCRRCAFLNLDAVLSRYPVTNGGEIVARLGSVSTWATASCSLCSLMAATLPKALHSKDENVLRSFSSNRTPRMGWNAVDTVMLSLDGSRECLFPQRRGAVKVRILEADSIDFAIPRTWLSLCDEMHTKNCAPRTRRPVPSFKLIDCETGAIISGADHPYVALSYVCGGKSKHGEWFAALPRDLPATVEDAMTVTRNLGYRYLWIDQYCINQSCKEELTAQLLRMDAIYRDSVVTIIAAAGEDATYGLPGVGKPRRGGNSHAQVGKHFFASSLNDPRHLIEDSIWRKRAWTYQEGILSRRRLVFTDEQVYFECYGMRCCETLDLPLRDMHRKSQQFFKMPFCEGDNIGMFPRDVGRSSWEILQRIYEYSQKILSNPTDILNGILGILRAFEEGSFKVRHCFGVPILPQIRDSASGRLIDWKVSGGLEPVAGLFFGLCWQLRVPSRRRPGFPSWSWVGWYEYGAVDWDRFDLEEIETDRGIDVCFELDGGHSINYNEFQKTYDQLNEKSALSGSIQISAWTTPIQLLKQNRNGVCKARMDLEDGGYLLWDFAPTTTQSLSTDMTYIGIHLGHHNLQSTSDRRSGFKTGPAFMVVIPTESGMERVALNWVDQMNYIIYEADGTEYRTEYLWIQPQDARCPKLVKSWQTILLC